jgi:monoamine oxidase
LELDHWNDKLYFSGSETAREYGGYMEGALYAARRVANALNLSETKEFTHV